MYIVLNQEKLLCEADEQKLKQDKNPKCFLTMRLVILILL